jgi:hypothetical protein
MCMQSVVERVEELLTANRRNRVTVQLDVQLAPSTHVQQVRPTQARVTLMVEIVVQTTGAPLVAVVPGGFPNH